MIVDALQAKLTVLHRLLESLQPGVIAVSGGVDSRLLLHVSWLWKLDFLPVYAKGPHQTALEQQRTSSLLQASEALSHVFVFNPLHLPEVRANSPLRCYWCKKALFSNIFEIAATMSRPWVLDGTQADDLLKHRPGQKALKELGVRSPLAEAEMTKAEIRIAASHLGLTDPEQPSRACLLTRFPYDRRISCKELEAVGWVEDRLSDLGLQRFRLRITHQEAALLQVHPDEEPLWSTHQDEIRSIAAAAGFGLPRLVWTRNLSGYFDELQPPSRFAEQP